MENIVLIEKYGIIYIGNEFLNPLFLIVTSKERLDQIIENIKNSKNKYARIEYYLRSDEAICLN